jgi:hypothetical protein
MGTSQSIPSTLSRQKVFELTRDTRGLMDIMLEYMLKEISVRDFLALSNPTECKKYVIFLANSLNKHFYELQITPIKDKKGVIAFRPVKDLIKDDDTEKQTLCLTLAYFYTRIFQIYGALALTVIDDANVISESGISSLSVDSIKRGVTGLVTPGYSSYMSKGGSISAATLGSFNFLRSFLIDDKDPQKGWPIAYKGEGNSRGQIFFYPKIEEKDEFGRLIITNIISETKVQRGVFFIAYLGAQRFSQLEAYAKLEGIGGNIKFSFGKLKYYNKKNAVNPESIDLPSDIITNKTITIQGERPAGGKAAYIYTILGSDKTISEYFTEILSKVVEFLKRNTLDETTTTTSSGVIISETGTTEELRLARIVQNLTKTKPLGHCLARAMQLLRTLPLKGEDAVSNICKSKFLEYTTISASGTKTTTTRSGIPEPGASLDTSPGLAALSQLFYDTIKEGTPRVVIGTDPGPGLDKKSSLQLYLEFMKKIGSLFEGEDFLNKPNEDVVKSGLIGIRNKRDNEWCRGITGNVTVPANKVSNIYNFVNQLYKIQIKHAAECGKIIKLLFNMNRDKFSGRYKISLSDNIIKKGFPEIERINFIARDLLIKYYTNCESTYLTGMSDILKIRAQGISNAQATAQTTAQTTTQTANIRPATTQAAPPTRTNPIPGARPTQI